MSVRASSQSTNASNRSDFPPETRNRSRAAATWLGCRGQHSQPRVQPPLDQQPASLFGTGGRPEQLAPFGLGAPLIGDILEGASVAARLGRVFAADGVQHALLTLFGDDSEIELELALGLGAQLEALGDPLAVLGVNVAKERVPDRRRKRLIASEWLIHLR